MAESFFGEGLEMAQKSYSSAIEEIKSRCNIVDVISPVVPLPYRSMASRAKRDGLKLYTMANSAGLAWDWGTVPFEPCPYQWNARYRAMRKANADWGLCGVMECHHFGWWPSFISEIEKEPLMDIRVKDKNYS